MVRDKFNYMSLAATMEGHVAFARGFMLERVLFIPTLHRILIYVSQLIEDATCFTWFAPSLLLQPYILEI